MANNVSTNSNTDTDLSDFNVVAGNSAEASPVQLPTRGEKRIIPSPISSSDLNNEVTKDLGNKARTSFANTGRTSLVQYDDFFAPAATYRFLINPSQVQVSRQTLDGQAMTRAGWQIGVWGEDSLSINLSGKTAGQYFSWGVTDAFQPYTNSYRNLEALVMVYENNGYWFEGEQAAEGPLAADFARRRIKMHEDVELWVGNFIWYGMFDSLTVSQSAEEPFLINFQISFIAWKERFRKTSPYQNLILNNVKRGHSYGAWASTATTAQKG